MINLMLKTKFGHTVYKKELIYRMLLENLYVLCIYFHSH